MPMLPQSSWSPTFAARTEGASGELAAILGLAAGTDLISFAAYLTGTSIDVGGGMGKYV